MMPLGLNPPEQERNWLDLPSDVWLNILGRVGMVDILDNVQKVCTSWSKVCKDPFLWRVINTDDIRYSASDRSTAEIVCKHAVDRSQGQLADISLIHEDNAAFFLYVSDRSSQLRRLEMAFCSNLGGLTIDVFKKFPLLEELSLYSLKISTEGIETVGRYCPMLKTLKVNEKLPGRRAILNADEETFAPCNKIAIAIGQNLPVLRHLELLGNNMTDMGLQVILDNCRHLETLDLRGCRNIHFNGDLLKKCFEEIKDLNLPSDSLYGCPYFDELLSDGEDIYEQYDDVNYDREGEVYFYSD